jgi:tetratricopeptide (TPR) repeat protein
MNSMFDRLWALVGELKRRHVYRVAAVYGVTAFVVLQVADMVFPALLLPDWAFRLLVALAILGFPLALILAWAFDLTPDGLERSRPAATPTQEATVTPRRRWHARAVALVLGAVGVGVAASFGLLRARQDPPVSEVDPGVLAVLPFRVAGAEPTLAYLREGMVDLMAAKLIGDVGPRALDPRFTLSAWRRTVDANRDEDLAPEPALRFAERLGAGQLMLGEVVSAPGQVAISVVVREVPGGRERYRLSRTSRADNLLDLVDGLVAEVLAYEAGRVVRPARSLTTSLPAMRAYLTGVAAYRRGAYEEAVEHHEIALAADSAFALAALAQVTAAWWGGPADERFERVLARAWDLRARLGPRERASLLVYSGPGYPRPPTTAEILAVSQRVVQIAQDQPEAWFEFGDALFHADGVMRGSDPWPRAAQAFERAIELDPDFVAPIAHLLELVSARGDTAGVRRASKLYLARDSTGDIAYYLRWRAAAALEDTIALSALRDRVEDAPTSSLARLVAIAQVDGIGLDDAERAAAVLSARRASDRGPPPELVQQLLALALNRGRPDEAVELLGDLGRRGDPTAGLQAAISHALYWDGDRATAAAAADELDRVILGDAPAVDTDTRSNAACALEQWRLHRGASHGAAAVIRELRRSGKTIHTFCADLLEVMGNRGRSGADAVQILERMDSLLWDATPSFAKWGQPVLPAYANLALAREFAARGDLDRALIAVRRRPYNWTITPFYLSSYLREEAWLAMEVGDEANARKALAHLELLRPGAGRMLTETRGTPPTPR